MKLTEFHKGMLKVDILNNQDIYSNVYHLGGFDPSCLVDTDIYTEINKDFGNKTYPNESKLKDKIDDLIEAYVLTFDLDPNKVGSFTKENLCDQND